MGGIPKGDGSHFLDLTPLFIASASVDRPCHGRNGERFIFGGRP